jgi:hypothetical protein
VDLLKLEIVHIPEPEILHQSRQDDLGLLPEIRQARMEDVRLHRRRERGKADQAGSEGNSN